MTWCVWLHNDLLNAITYISWLLQWIVVDSKVYDLSKFAALHPGGQHVLTTPNIGEHATSQRALLQYPDALPQLDKTLLKHFSPCTAKRCSTSRSTSGWY